MLGSPAERVIDIGSVLNGKYRLVRLVGDGGMGSVYEGLHLVLGTRVAIKVLHPDLARRTGLVERFLQEARVAAQIRSAHVVQVTDVDRTGDGHAYIVMELLEGEPLSSVLDRQRRLPVPTACEYTQQILAALEAAHALGVIHRDLKPENVFVTFQAGKPVLKLIDFGIAKAKRTDPQAKGLTVAGVVMGTAEYMAPEQARSADKVDARADIYAVGVMLYEMLCGARPVGGDDARVIALKIERGEITPLVQRMPDVPRELAGLVHRAMAARPELRFATATEMRVALEQAAMARRATAQVAAAANASVGPMPPLGELTATGTLKNVNAAQVLGQHAGRTGTAPVPQVPTPPNTSDGYEPAPRTERAPPVQTNLAMPAYAGAQMPTPPGYPAAYTPEPPPAPRRRGNRGLVIALVSLSLLLGAGVVAMLITSGTLTLGGDSTPPPPRCPSARTRAPAPRPRATRRPPRRPPPAPCPRCRRARTCRLLRLPAPVRTPGLTPHRPRTGAVGLRPSSSPRRSPACCRSPSRRSSPRRSPASSLPGRPPRPRLRRRPRRTAPTSEERRAP